MNEINNTSVGCLVAIVFLVLAFIALNIFGFWGAFVVLFFLVMGWAKSIKVI